MGAYTKSINYNENWTMNIDSDTADIYLTQTSSGISHYIDLNIGKNLMWLYLLATSRLHVDELCQSLFDNNTSTEPIGE